MPTLVLKLLFLFGLFFVTTILNLIIHKQISHEIISDIQSNFLIF